MRGFESICTDEELDGLLSPLKILLDRRERYTDVQAESDLFQIFDKFQFDPTFIRRSLEYMDAHPDGDVYTTAYRVHILRHIETINRNEEIDLVIH